MLPEKLLGQHLGPYQIESIVGSGGMAVVYRARRTDDETVALKVLFPPPGAGAEIRLRFEREARMVARLRHPAIVRVIDAGQTEGYAYIAMTLVEGQSLASYLHQAAPLDEALAADIAWQIADALAYAHSQGVVHRDVKPSNILLTGDGRALLTDFGVAQALDDPSLTRTGQTIGTPAYMAPEQARGDQPIDGRADLYALGVVLYHMVTGHTPFQGTTPHILHAHLYDPPPLPSQVTQTSPSLEAIILRALAKEPGQRFQTGTAMSQALANLNDQTGTYAALPTSPDLKESAVSRPSRWLWLVLVPALLIGALALWQLNGSDTVDPLLSINLSPTQTATETSRLTPTPGSIPDQSAAQTPLLSPTASVAATPTPTASATLTPTFTPSPTPVLPTPPPVTDTPIPLPSPTPCPQLGAPEFSNLLINDELRTRLGCPRNEAGTTSAAWQPFEQGAMLWRGDRNLIYILEPNNRWRSTGDTWREGDPEFSVDIVAPEGLFQPVRGFGKAWREQTDLREMLGWAINEEQGFDTLLQDFSGGLAWQDPDRNRVIILLNDGTYQIEAE